MNEYKIASLTVVVEKLINDLEAVLGLTLIAYEKKDAKASTDKKS